MALAPIHVAHVVQNMPIGGMERVVASLVEKIDHSRYVPHVYCLETAGALAAEVRDRGFDVTAMNKKPGLSVSLPLRLAGEFRRARVDLVHCHNFGGLFYGGIAGKLSCSKAVLYTAHGPELPYDARKALFQRLPLVDMTIAVSNYVMASAISKAGLSPSKVRMIHNGIDVSGFDCTAHDREAERTRLGQRTDEPLLGVVARLSPEKDHETLLNALKLVKEDFEQVVLAIAGDGELMEPLTNMAERLGLTHSVRFLGTCTDVPRFLESLDLFVLSSRQEGLGITLLEAMAAGLPVVATNTGGIPEVVIPGETGLLVPAGNPSLFAKSVIWVLSHRAEARAMGMRGRQRVQREFSVGKMVSQYQTVYDEILALK